MIKEGSKAPELNIPDQNGEITKLSDFNDNITVLYFYPKDDTPGCTLEAIEFTKLKKAFLSLNAVVVGVSADDQKSHQKFIEKCDLGIPLLSDTGKRVVEKYGVWKEKQMYGRKYMGIERTTFVIQEGRIIKIFPKVNPEGHAQQVLDFLKTL